MPLLPEFLGRHSGEIAGLSMGVSILLVAAIYWPRLWHRRFRLTFLVQSFLILSCLSTFALGLLWISSRYFPDLANQKVKNWTARFSETVEWRQKAYAILSPNASSESVASATEPERKPVVPIRSLDQGTIERLSAAVLFHLQKSEPFASLLGFPFGVGQDPVRSAISRDYMNYLGRESKIEQFVGKGRDYFFEISPDVAPAGFDRIAGPALQRHFELLSPRLAVRVQVVAAAGILVIQAFTFGFLALLAYRDLRPANSF
jgi:hypothetical protein